MPTLPADRLAHFAADLFRAGGVPADAADLVARSLGCPGRREFR